MYYTLLHDHGMNVSNNVVRIAGQAAAARK